MKIAILEPYDRDSRYEMRSLTPNPGPVIVGTILSQQGHKVTVYSEYVSEIDVALLDHADLVGISITTYNAQKGFKIAAQLRQPVVFGGFHASLMPEECLQYGDFVIRGDGGSIVDLICCLKKGGGALDRIDNLVFQKNGKVRYNRMTSRPIDVIPNFGLVENFHCLNINYFLRIPILVNGSRGCHCNCSFCAIKAVYTDFRRKSVETVIADIRTQIRQRHKLTRLFPKNLWITDDNFTSDKKWAKDLLREMALLKLGYTFAIQARVDIAEDDELLALMKKSGIVRVYIGIESLRQESLSLMQKHSSPAKINQAIQKIRKAGMDVHGLFVFGDDWFQKGDGRRVAEFVIKNRLSGILIQPLTPYPGTKLFEKLERENRILTRDWKYYNGKVVFKPKHLTPQELQEEIYDCYRRIFSLMHVIRFLFFGNKGSRLELLGEALFRRLNSFKERRYIQDFLENK